MRTKFQPSAWSCANCGLSECAHNEYGECPAVPPAQPEASSKDVPVPLCGEVVIHLIAGASYFGCALLKGHIDGHRAAGLCFKHGLYLGQEGKYPMCPEWPNCTNDIPAQDKPPSPQPADDLPLGDDGEHHSMMYQQRKRPADGIKRAQACLVANKPKPPQRPTIAELQAILDSAELQQEVEINPDGSVGVGVLESQAQSHAAFAASEVKRARTDIEQMCMKRAYEIQQSSYGVSAYNELTELAAQIRKLIEERNGGINS